VTTLVEQLEDVAEAGRELKRAWLAELDKRLLPLVRWLEKGDHDQHHGLPPQAGATPTG
jgi:predicted oxidoreductase